MPKTRKLSDLYVVGKEVKVDDGSGDPVTIWLQKLNPVDHESAMRKANSKRARTLAMKSKHDTPEFEAIMSQVYDLDTDSLIDYIVMPEIQKFQMAREEEFGAEEEWSKDNYLQGLRDAWNDGLERKYAEDKEDSEAQRVYAELKRFSDLVVASSEVEEKNLRMSYAAVPVEELQEKVAIQFVEMQADMEWMKEFHRNELYYAVRDPQAHKKRYFESLDELDTLSIEVLDVLNTEYRKLTVDITEGKDSQATDGSSPSSEPPVKEEQAASSGPEVATP